MIVFRGFPKLGVPPGGSLRKGVFFFRVKIGKLPSPLGNATATSIDENHTFFLLEALRVQVPKRFVTAPKVRT